MREAMADEKRRQKVCDEFSRALIKDMDAHIETMVRQAIALDRPLSLEEVAIPLTKKGRKIKKAMVAQYGKKRGTKILYASAMTSQYGKKKGARIFYASQTAGVIKGTHRKNKKK